MVIASSVAKVLVLAGSAFNGPGALNDAATGEKLDVLCQRLVDVMANNHR